MSMLHLPGVSSLQQPEEMHDALCCVFFSRLPIASFPCCLRTRARAYYIIFICTFPHPYESAITSCMYHGPHTSVPDDYVPLLSEFTNVKVQTGERRITVFLCCFTVPSSTDTRPPAAHWPPLRSCTARCPRRPPSARRGAAAAPPHCGWR